MDARPVGGSVLLKGRSTLPAALLPPAASLLPGLRLLLRALWRRIVSILSPALLCGLPRSGILLLPLRLRLLLGLGLDWLRLLSPLLLGLRLPLRFLRALWLFSHRLLLLLGTLRLLLLRLHLPLRLLRALRTLLLRPSRLLRLLSPLLLLRLRLRLALRLWSTLRRCLLRPSLLLGLRTFLLTRRRALLLFGRFCLLLLWRLRVHGRCSPINPQTKEGRYFQWFHFETPNSAC
jgi:hypothetical protein